MEAAGQKGDPDEEPAEDHRHQRQRGRRVLRLGGSEGGDTVGDRLDAREGDGTRGESLEQEKEAQGAPGLPRADEGALIEGDGLQVAGIGPDQAEDDHRGGEDDVGVGRNREERSGLFHAAQVGEGDHGDGDQAKDDPLRRQALQGGQRHDGGHTGRDGYRHGQDVVDHQGGRGDEGRIATEVLPADDVGPATARVGEDRLPVGADHHHEQGGDDDRDGNELGEPEGQARPARHQHDQYLFGGVRRRRDGVGRKRRQGDHLAHPLLALLIGRQWTAEKQALYNRRHREGSSSPADPRRHGEAAGGLRGWPERSKGDGDGYGQWTGTGAGGAQPEAGQDLPGR